MAMASAFATAMIIEGKGSKAEETDIRPLPSEEDFRRVAG
jgi:hypothetical protein